MTVVSDDRSSDPASVEKPAEQPPDAGQAYDPSMTDEDEANIPRDSDADPNASEAAED